MLRFGYSSLTTPNSTFDYNMATREKTLLKQQEVVGEFNPENYQAERINVKARDGNYHDMLIKACNVDAFLHQRQAFGRG